MQQVQNHFIRSTTACTHPTQTFLLAAEKGAAQHCCVQLPLIGKELLLAHTDLLIDFNPDSADLLW